MAQPVTVYFIPLKARQGMRLHVSVIVMNCRVMRPYVVVSMNLELEKVFLFLRGL